jgi:hypothetical protein
VRVLAVVESNCGVTGTGAGTPFDPTHKIVLFRWL